MDTITLSRARFRAGNIAALLIILSFLLASILPRDFADATDDGLSLALYATGWAVAAWGVLHGRGAARTTVMTGAVVTACALLLVSTLLVQEASYRHLQASDTVVVSYFSGWVLLLGAMHRLAPATAKSRVLGIAAAGAAAIISSTVTALPMQRLQCSVDGPGMPMYTAGWLALAYANALT